MCICVYFLLKTKEHMLSRAKKTDKKPLKSRHSLHCLRGLVSVNSFPIILCNSDKKFVPSLG